MGQFDRNNYLVVIKGKENITDSAYREYCDKTNMMFTIQEYHEFEDCHPHSSHPLIAKMIDFISSYKNGKFRPDKWGFGYPLNREFSDESRDRIISLISLPGGEETLKKLRMYEMEIKNDTFCPIWCKGKPIERNRKLPDYLYSITFYFSKSLKNIYPVLVELTEDFCKHLDTDFGEIIDQSTETVIYKYSPEKEM